MTNSKLTISGSMENLSRKLAGNLRSAAVPVFSKTMIVTQGGAMNNWITGQITRENKVFANHQFQNQDGFMKLVYEILTGEKMRSNHDNMKFGIYHLLASNGFKNDFPDVASYYQGYDRRRVQLSEKIADLFDQYQLYRSDMIGSWQNMQLAMQGNKHEKWQMWLWNQLDIPSKSEIKDIIFTKLEKEADILKKEFPEIHVFGIAIFTDFHLDFYKKLAQFIPVHFYIFLPSKSSEYKHTLLESFGTKYRELQQQFSDINAESHDYPEMKPQTMLEKLQDNIHQGINGNLPGSDDSITITSHFTITREVETLYNYLLNLFENERDLKPADVMVVAPDINTYEPYIKAVFRNAPVALPFTVSGAARTAGDTITAALEQISIMQEEDMYAENVMRLLEISRVGKAYNISDTAYTRAMINKAGIRFGRQNKLVDDSHFVSFQYGLEKFILGYAMLTDTEFDVSYRLNDEQRQELSNGKLTNFPFMDAEASASDDLLRLKAFTSDLEVFFDEQGNTHTFDEWKKFWVEKIMTKMVWSDDFNKDDRKERNEIFRALSFTAEMPEGAGNQKIPWEVFLNELKKRLFTESAEHDLSKGTITFTSAIPVRGIPANVIAFLGLDNGVFPRQDTHLGFDLMGNDHQPGDRSKKEADKSLFLDLIMSARQKLYLSYIGQDVKDNATIPPSIVLDTLLDHLGMEPQKHPLHGFSNKYNDGELFTYLYHPNQDSRLQDKKDAGSAQHTSGQPHTLITTQDFIRFFQAPMDWYFRKVLGIYYGDDLDDTLPETEMFGLDGLQKWSVKNELLRMAEDGKLEEYTRQGAMKGKLPLKNLGRKTVEDLWDELAPLRDRYTELTEKKEERSIPVDLIVHGFRIKGTEKSVFDDEYIFVSTSTSKSTQKYQVYAYVTSLLLYASGTIKNARFLGLKNKKLYEQVYPFMEKDAALAKLEELAVYLQKGKEQPLIFTLDSTKKNRYQPEITLESVMKALQKETEDTSYNGQFIPGNSYIKKLMEEGYFGNLNDDDVEDIKALAELLNIK